MRTIYVFVLVLVFSMWGVAQGPFGKLADPTLELRSVVWNPQPGQGSEYDINTHNGTSLHVSLTITGTENVNGQTGYWLEIGGNFEQLGQIYSQTLMTQSAGKLQKQRWILQLPNNPPMEMSQAAMPQRARRSKTAAEDTAAADPRSNGVRVGSESVTVPAGTFQCEHWRAKDGTGDVWLSTSVVPYSVVKAVDKDGGMMTLTKLISGGTSHLTGKAVPFDPAVMMALGQARQSR